MSKFSSTAMRLIGMGAIGVLGIAGAAGCGSKPASGSQTPVHSTVVRSTVHIPRSKFHPAVTLKIPAGDVGYPSEGVILAAAPAEVSPAISPGAVLKSFKRQTLARDVLGAAISRAPAVKLQLVTEYDPTYPGLKPGVKYPGWVVTYTGVKPISYGPKPPPRGLRCRFVGIFDLTNSAWTTFFSSCP